jgi:hypothetical protein
LLEKGGKVEKKAGRAKTKKIPVGKKFSRLSEADREYVKGYTDRALVQVEKERGEQAGKKRKTGNGG